MTASPTSAPRAHRAVVAIAVGLHLVHQWTYRRWFIDDAAISFAYARNLVAGEGLVAVPGGERIEGYSNPLWVAMLSIGEVFGLDGFASAKWMTAALGAAAIVLAWKLARKALPNDDGPGALLAPLILGLSAHHAIWSASALENALMNALVLGGLLALLDDVERARWPRSALWFVGVALTRPEGLLYAAVAGGWFLLFQWRERRTLRPVAAWVGLFWLPYGAFILWRLWYFAFPLPNTYYAKLATQGSFPWRWYGRGWIQLRDYAARLWQGWFLPLYLLGLLGWKGRERLILMVSAVAAMFLLIPGPDALKALWFWPALPDPLPWIRVRVVVLTAMALLLPLAALGRPGGRARALAWSMAVVAAAFSVISNGDWMDGLRWMSFFQPEAAVLLAVGGVELSRMAAERAGERPWHRVGWAVATAVVGLQLAPNLQFSRWYQDHWDDYPEMIHPRVLNTETFARKVFLDEPIKPLDMDMGAHLMWSAQRPVDMAGLVDIPMSLHRYDQRAFIKEYVLEEQRPHVAHVHSTWAEISGFPSYPRFQRDYQRITGYPDGDWYHGGIYIRRDLVMNDHSVDPTETVGFARGVALRGIDLPSPVAGAGRALYVDTAWSTAFARGPDDPFTVTMFLYREGRLHSWDLPMGLAMVGEPLVPVHDWAPNEPFRGQYALRLPEDLPPGSYDLGFVVWGARGFVLAAGGDPGDPQPVAQGALVGGRDTEPVLSVGEVRFPARVEIVSAEQAVQAADEDRIAALEAAWSDLCRAAEDRWVLARRHLPADPGYVARHRPEVADALAGCWTRLAAEDSQHAPARLARAHRWNHRNPEFLAARGPVADALYAEGRAAMERGDWQVAYQRFTEVLSFAPERSWARRYAEEARDHRLGLGDG